MSLRASTSQTIGPFLRIGLEWMQIEDLAPQGVAGERVQHRGPRARRRRQAGQRCRGRDLAGQQPRQVRAAPRIRRTSRSRAGFRGYGRSLTDDAGPFRFRTIKPGRVPGPDGRLQAPHLVITVFMRGLLKQLVTRMYFPDEPSNADDPVLKPGARRATRHA